MFKNIPVGLKYTAIMERVVKKRRLKDIQKDFNITESAIRHWLANKDTIIQKYESIVINGTEPDNHIVKKRNLKSIETKRKALRALFDQEKTREEIRNEHNITIGTLNKWIRNREIIFQTYEKQEVSKRAEAIKKMERDYPLSGYPAIEKAVSNWYYENKEQYRLNYVPISVNDLKRKAEDFAILYKFKDFKACNAWIISFMYRYNIKGVVFTTESPTMEVTANNSESTDTEECQSSSADCEVVTEEEDNDVSVVSGKSQSNSIEHETIDKIDTIYEVVSDDDQETSDDVIVIEGPQSLNMHQAIPDDVRKAYTTLRLFFQSRPFDTSQHLKALQEMSHDPRIKF